MPVQFKFFIVALNSLPEAESELNRFLRSKKVLTVHREFVPQGDNSFWCLAVEYLTGDSEQGSARSGSGKKDRVDYKELLPPEDFALFARLRDWRKQVAASEAVPVYTIFNNEQLALIVEKRVTTVSDLKKIEGVGEARVQKYGEDVLKIVKESAHSNNGEAE